ncbi:MAG: malate synthase G, partial [Gammaproteobacteria bacterium]|nr:malate synthase G [Gammaproteobacteria bacterium]
MSLPLQKHYQINQLFYNFINAEVLPQVSINQNVFWNNLELLFAELIPINQQLLQTRNRLQSQLNNWHQQHQGDDFDFQSYQKFLKEIGYLLEEGDDFEIETSNVDDEITTVAGPQLVVPLKNARFALNAVNARWGSLYDALYGTDVIPKTDGLKVSEKHNPARAARVIHKAKEFLDDIFPLSSGSHHDVTSYVVYFQNLLAFFPDGSSMGLTDPKQFVALCGHKSEPCSILLKNNGLHVEIQIDRSGFTGEKDLAGVNDIIVEAAITAIMDFEDSVAAVDAEDKVEVYRNWLGLIQGDLEARFEKKGKTYWRHLERDLKFRSKEDGEYRLPGRSLMLA